MKNIIFSIALLSILSSLAFAENDFMVKVNSFVCSNKKNSKIGSGTILSIRNSTYILSSDHVLFHGDTNANICNKVLYRGNLIDAKLVAVNSMKGLSLLRVDGINLGDALDYNTISSNKNTTPSGFTTLLGFPSSSLSVLADRNAQILNPKSTRKILPLIQQVIEVKGHSEYGMSGGALIDYQNKFAGVLSHQYLQMNLGAPSSIKNYEEGTSSGELIALVIPLQDIVSWIDAVLAKGKSEEFRFDVNSQVKRNEAIVIEGVRFQLQTCKENTGAVGGEGAGIGGRARGGEGAGIGGGSEAQAGICSISLSWNKDSQAWSNPWPLAHAPWFEQLKEKLLSGSNAQMTGLFYQGNRLDLTPSIQLLSLFQKGALPLIRIDAPFSIDSESAMLLKRQSAEAALIIQRFQANKNLQSYDNQDLLKQMKLLTEALDNAQWEIAFQSNIQKLLEDDSWNDLLQEDFNGSVALKSALLKIQAELNKIRI